MDTVYRSFAGGEVAPGLYGRPDTTKVQTGARTMRNMFVRRHGGASNRTGGKFICEQYNSDARGRLLKFVFNAEQTYVLLFEHQSMQVIRDGAVLTVPNATAWDVATAYVIGDVVSDGGANYYCILAHTGQATSNVTYWYAMPDDDIYQIPTPWNTADLQDIYRSQSGDIVTVTHTGYNIYDLSRTGHTTWVIDAVAMEPDIDAPTGLTDSGAAGTVTMWVATAVKNETYEESLPSASTGTSATPTAGAPITVTIGGLVADALEYNIYKNEGSGIYGFIGTASATGVFVDLGHVPDYDLTPPADRDPFDGADEHPAVSGYLQQRKAYGGLPSAPETAYLSKTGQYKNFGISSPLRLNDACTYAIASREVNEIRHMLEVMETFILTAGVEWVALGGADGALTPGSPGLKPKSFYGSSTVPPVIIGDNILFIQALGSLVRDLNYDATAKGYSGRDLSVFAPHLFVGKTIEHWDYAQTPDSIVLAQQDDGTMIGLTYLPEHEVWGWFHYDTDGYYEDVISIPEDGEHAVYYLVRREIDGVTKRYLERFASRTITDIALDATFMDSFLSYDGRLSGDGMTLSGGTDWLYSEDLTMTYAGASYFVAGDVGNSMRLELYETTYTPEAGYVTTHEYLICTITAYIGVTSVTVNAHRTVPANFRDVEIGDFAKGVDEISGLDHLEGKAVAILADGNVLTNGIDAPLTVVTGGSITLEEPYFVIHVGLPYCSDLQTLDLELDGGEPLAAKKKHVGLVAVHVEASRGLWVGEGPQLPDGDLHLREWRQRPSNLEDGEPIPMFTGKIEVSIGASWNTGGRVFLRQRDPLPLTVLNVIPNVSIGG